MDRSLPSLPTLAAVRLYRLVTFALERDGEGTTEGHRVFRVKQRVVCSLDTLSSSVAFLPSTTAGLGRFTLLGENIGLPSKGSRGRPLHMLLEIALRKIGLFFVTSSTRTTGPRPYFMLLLMAPILPQLAKNHHRPGRWSRPWFDIGLAYFSYQIRKNRTGSDSTADQ